MSFVIHWESGKLCKKYWLHKQQQVLVAGTCKYLQVPAGLRSVTGICIFTGTGPADPGHHSCQLAQIQVSLQSGCKPADPDLGYLQIHSCSALLGTMDLSRLDYIMDYLD
jgi:hypothetical protein